MKFSRKIKRKRNLEKNRHVKKNLKKFESSLKNMPKKCSICGVGFDPKKDLDSWFVEVSAVDNVKLICGDCRGDGENEG